MQHDCYFEGSETYYADLESDSFIEEFILNASWVSQR